MHMTKKGVIQEIFSRAQFVDNPINYKITYRDFELLRELALPDFISESNNFQKIPISGIKIITKNNKIVFKKKSMER